MAAAANRAVLHSRAAACSASHLARHIGQITKCFSHGGHFPAVVVDWEPNTQWFLEKHPHTDLSHYYDK